MAYTDDAVKAKLSALNETQESIVTVAQWIMFHRRHADRTAQLWREKLRDSNPPKRLNLIYLANEVAQQSKAKRKEDFLIAFSPIIADATATAFKGASNDIQVKLRRVVEVWRQRLIFEKPIQDAIETRVEEVDKSRSNGKKPLLGGSLFSNSQGSFPSELQPLVPLQTAASKASVSVSATATTANTEYEKMIDPSTAVPTPPVHAARLSTLLKALANAESSVSDVMRCRQSLIEGLEKILDSNRSALEKEKVQFEQLSARKIEIEDRKKDVEDAIMRGLSADEAASGTEHNGHSADGPFSMQNEPMAPVVEALTPPPVESLTPVQSPKPKPISEAGNGDETMGVDTFTIENNVNPGQDIFSYHDDLTLALESSSKKRKVAHSSDNNTLPDFEGEDAMAGLDAEVAELLRQEGAKY